MWALTLGGDAAHLKAVAEMRGAARVVVILRIPADAVAARAAAGHRDGDRGGNGYGEPVVDRARRDRVTAGSRRTPRDAVGCGARLADLRRAIVEFDLADEPIAVAVELHTDFDGSRIGR